MMSQGRFVLKSPFKPQGDQPQAIAALAEGVNAGMPCQVLLGVTGSGKTYTMASVIEKVQRPTLVIAHNKTLAAQLCSEFREFFPDSAVEYFVSYYDYYQPEAYIASTDTYIEKDSSVNEEIERLRHSATAALRERRDVIVVASVSCIYSMGDPSEYEGMMISLRPGMTMERDDLIRSLVEIQYDRVDIEFERGTFRVRGDVVEIFPAGYESSAIRVEFFGDEIDRITTIEVVSGHTIMSLKHISIYPATHYATPRELIDRAIETIDDDLTTRIKEFKRDGQLLEAQRIEQPPTMTWKCCASWVTAPALKTTPATSTAASPAMRPIRCLTTSRRITSSLWTRATSPCRRCGVCTAATMPVKRVWWTTVSVCPAPTITAP